MSFASPLWLLGLLPWAGVTIRLLLGRRRSIGVPFIRLWHGQTDLPRAKPSLAPPPLAILLAILSLLIAVLASARPVLRSRTGLAITIIVDRGITMSAKGEHDLRFKETCDGLAGRLLEGKGNGPVKLISVPGDLSTQLDRTSWELAVTAMGPTFQNSRPELLAATRRSLAAGNGDVIVVSDQPVPTDPRVLQIEPDREVSNLTIADVGARAVPRAQVMVRLRDQGNVGNFRQAHIRVESDGHTGTQDLQVPRDGSATGFIDLPAMGPAVTINVDAPDDLAADNQAWLAREQTSAVIQGSPAIPEPLQRMIAVYRRHRDSAGSNVRIVTNPVDVSADEPTIIVAPDSLPASPLPLHVEAHPLTANIDWKAVTDDARGGTAPAGWSVLVSKGSAALLALRGEPVPAVWICLNSPHFPLEADYVVFWTQIFDWLGGEDVYRWHPMDAHANPGIESGADGTLRAYNAIDVDFPPVHPNDWQRLRAMDRELESGADVTPYACLTSLILMVVAVALLSSAAQRVGGYTSRSQPRTIDSIT